jgi:hypothetical protein
MLNDYQKRGLSITLRIVEENVEYIEQLLKSRGYSGVLYETRYDLTDEIRDELSKRIPLVRAELGRIADKFQLGKKNEAASNAAFGKLPYCWEILENAKAKRLRQYGDIAEGLGGKLDPHLDTLIRILGEMERILLVVRKS